MQHSYFWETRSFLPQQKKFNQKKDFSSGEKNHCKPNPLARKSPSVVSRPSDTLARLRGHPPAPRPAPPIPPPPFSLGKDTGKHEVTCVNQQRLSSPENRKATHYSHSCTANCTHTLEHNCPHPCHPTLPSGFGLNETHSLWLTENKNKMLVIITTGKLKEITPGSP